jgi:hypothetical protein
VRELADDQDPPAERRRVVFDAELSAILKVVRREGSILGDILRKSFDYAPLRHSTVERKWVVATGHHIAVLGSITPTELRTLLDGVDLANGFGNRFLYAHSRLTNLLPYGGDVDRNAVGEIVDRLHGAFATLEKRIKFNGTANLPLDPGAKKVWEQAYAARRTGYGEGLVQALSARHVAHAARLSVIYATLDGSPVIRAKHVLAALAWLDYSNATVEKVFVQRPLGKPGRLLTAVRDAMPDGTTSSELHRTVAHNWPAGELADVRAELERAHLVVVVQEGTDGRPRDRWYALTPRKKGSKGGKPDGA